MLVVQGKSTTDSTLSFLRFVLLFLVTLLFVGMEGITLYRWYLAQQYINAPMLINGRKFGIRLWVLVPGALPLRVYLHRNGLALFSATRYKPAGLWGVGWWWCGVAGGVNRCGVTAITLF